jgi:hypothetical protein
MRSERLKVVFSEEPDSDKGVKKNEIDKNPFKNQNRPNEDYQSLYQHNQDMNSTSPPSGFNTLNQYFQKPMTS